MDISKEIRKICIDEDISVSKLADRLGQSRQNFNHKLMRSNFPVKQLEEIAEALGYRLEIRFIKDGEDSRKADR